MSKQRKFVPGLTVVVNGEIKSDKLLCFDSKKLRNEPCKLENLGPGCLGRGKPFCICYCTGNEACFRDLWCHCRKACGCPGLFTEGAPSVFATDSDDEEIATDVAVTSCINCEPNTWTEGLSVFRGLYEFYKHNAAAIESGRTNMRLVFAYIREGLMNGPECFLDAYTPRVYICDCHAATSPTVLCHDFRGARLRYVFDPLTLRSVYLPCSTVVHSSLVEYRAVIRALRRFLYRKVKEFGVLELIIKFAHNPQRPNKLTAESDTKTRATYY